MSKAILSVILLIAGLLQGACENMPGKDGRYATRTSNRGEANTGLPVTPYEPR
jgi:hypothetical protein